MDNSTSELDYFSQLSSKDTQSRAAAVRGILKRIRHNSKHSHHVVYLICKRLIRGLGGSNANFRLGCFTSVVGFFSLLPPDFDLSSLEEIIDNELNPTGNNSKQEEGEAYLGQILAYGAMIASDFITNKSEEEQLKIVDKIYQLSKKRSYLHHSAFVFLSMCLNKIKKELTPEGFVDHLKDLEMNALDKLNYIFTLAGLHIKTHTIKQIFETKKLYDPSNASKLVALIKKNRSPKLSDHEFFNTFVNSVCKHSQFLLSFWNTFCDLKQGKDTVEGKPDRNLNSYESLILNFSGKLFKKLREDTNGNLALELFNDSFINLLCNYKRKDKKLVNSILDDFCAAVISLDDDSKLKFIKKILFKDGLLNFDSMTNSKTIITLTNNLSFDGISELAELYKEVLNFQREVKKFDSKNKAIIICLNYYTKLINNPSCYEKTEWRLSQLIYLLKMGFFQAQDANINRELRQQLQEAFLTSLGHRFPNLDCFHKILEGLVGQMNIFLRDEESVVIKFTSEMEDAWKNTLTLCEKMNKHLKKETENKEIILVLKIILQYMAILLLKEANTAITNIQDLQHIFEDLIKKKDGSQETVWIEVLIDLFLNLLSKPYYHHRHLIRSTFKSISSHITEKSFLQIVEVLHPSYESGEIEDESENEENENDEDSTEGSDVDEDEEMENDDEDIENDDEQITATEKLRFELQNVLGGGSDNESIDLDEMDEEEGKKLDETLSSIFRANVKKRKTDHLSKYQNQLAHFRTRVMDLIEICTEVTIPLSFWLKVLTPLIDLLASTVGQNKLNCLRSRIASTIKKLNSSKALQDETPVDEIVKVVEVMLEKASKSTGIYADIKPELTLVIKFILKSSKPFTKGLKPKHIEKNAVFQSYKTHFEGFFLGKNNLPIQLLSGLTSIGWDGMLVLIPDAVRYLFDENVKVHKKLISVKIIDAFIKTPQYFDGHLEKYYEFYIPRIEQIFTSSFIKEVEAVCNTQEINMKYLSELISLVNIIIIRQKNSQLPAMINVQSIKDSFSAHLEEFSALKGKCKKLFYKLYNTLGIDFPLKEEKNVNPDASINSPKSLLKRKRKGDMLVKKKKIKKMSQTTSAE